MSIYTKTGDDGKTSLYTGERVDKNSIRVQTYGAVDETNSCLAIARSFAKDSYVKEKIFELQKLLPLLMADLASIGQTPMIQNDHISMLENEMDMLEKKLPPLRKFIIPGDSQAGAFLDLARTTCRRAERSFYELSKSEETHDVDKIFLNRLSDFCFLLMRVEDSIE